MTDPSPLQIRAGLWFYSGQETDYTWRLLKVTEHGRVEWYGEEETEHVASMDGMWMLADFRNAPKDFEP